MHSLNDCMLAFICAQNKEEGHYGGRRGERNNKAGGVYKEEYFLSKCIVHICQNVMMKAITFYN